MRTARKRLFATFCLFSLVALLPMSCGLLCRDSCGCGPSPKLQEIRIKSFKTLTANQSNTEIPDTETAPYDQTFVTLRIDEVEFKTQSSLEPKPTWTLGTAFACSPLPPQTENTLYLVQIINEKEFTTSDGTQYSIGENITSLFGMNHLFLQGMTTVESFIAPSLKLSYDDYFKIGFLENPEKEVNLEFTIRLVFDDGQEFLLSDQILNIE